VETRGEGDAGTKVSAGSGRWLHAAGAFVLGLILLSLLIWAFLYAPDTLPEFKQRMLAIGCALLAGFFAYFLTGSIGLEGKALNTPWGGLSVRATGGVAVFILVLIWWLSPMTPIQPDKAVQPQPPVVNGGGGPMKPAVTPLAPLRTQSRVNKVALSRDGELLASAEEDGTVNFWQVKSGNSPQKLAGSGTGSPARCVAFGPNDQTMGAGSGDGKVRVWPTSDAAAPTIIASHTGSIYELYFSPDGDRVVSTGDDSGNVRFARLWKVSGKQPVLLKSFRLPNLDDQILAVSPDLLTVLFHSPTHKRVELWALADSKLQTALENSDLAVKTGAFSLDGQTVALGLDDGSVGIWGVKDGKPISTLTHPGERVVSVAVSPDGRTVAAGYPNGSVCLWGAKDYQALDCMREHTQRVLSLAFSANGSVLASGGEDGQIRLWEIKSKN
jgi:hypothetical protein